MKSIVKYILICLPFITACSSEKTDDSTQSSEVITSIDLNSEQMKNAGIEESFPVKQLIGMSINANGTVQVPPQNKIVISVPFGGFVKSLEVLDGMQVKKGQQLLSVEHPELIQLQQDYLEVVGNLEYLEAEYERQKMLVDKEAGSLKTMQLAKSQLNAAMAKRSGLRAKLDLAGINLKQLNSGNIQRTIAVVAPFNGVVTKVAVNVGAYADPLEHLLEIIDLKHAHAEVIVFEKDLRHLKIGQKVTLKFADQNESVAASVFLIGKEIGKDRTVKAHCHLDSENPAISPGAYFNAVIHTGESEMYCLPSEAIVEMDGQSVVFESISADKGSKTFKPVPVSVLATQEGFSAIEFKDSKKEFGQKLVTKGAYDILSAFLIQSESD